MERAGMRFLATAAAVAATLMSTAAAEAANRFASPTGGTTEPCLESNPCDIATAVTGDAGGRPHDVTLTGGVPPAAPYTISSSLNVPGGVTVHGAPGARPLLQGMAPVGNFTSRVFANAVLRDVTVDHSDANTAAVFVDSGTLERVQAKGVGTGCAANPQSLIRDSVCWATSAGSGTGIQLQLGFSGAETITLRNVTAIASGATAVALRAVVFGDNGILNVNATNVIAQTGGGPDVTGGGLPCCTGEVVNFNLDHSNYDSELEDESSASDVVITNPGDPASQNQTTPPVFTDAAAGDFTQTAASTGTINDGVGGGGLGAFDLNGLDRLQGTAPDIGAHEFPEADPPVTPPTDPPIVNNPPAVNIPPAQSTTAKKCKKGQKLKKGKCVKKKRKKKRKQ